MQGLSGDDKETGQAASQLSSSMEHLRSISEQPEPVLQRVRDELSYCAQYSGVAVVCEQYVPLYWKYSVKQELVSKLEFQYMYINVEYNKWFGSVLLSNNYLL